MNKRVSNVEDSATDNAENAAKTPVTPASNSYLKSPQEADEMKELSASMIQDNEQLQKEIEEKELENRELENQILMFKDLEIRKNEEIAILQDQNSAYEDQLGNMEQTLSAVSDELKQ